MHCLCKYLHYNSSYLDHLFDRGHGIAGCHKCAIGTSWLPLSSQFGAVAPFWVVWFVHARDAFVLFINVYFVCNVQNVVWIYYYCDISVLGKLLEMDNVNICYTLILIVN